MVNWVKKSECEFMSVQYTTIIKGVAILIIMLSHMANFWGVRWFTPLGGIGVAMFLTISGYGLAESYKKIKLENYWVKKIINLKLFYYIGKVSFELYLIHGYTIALLKYGNWQCYVAFIISSFLLAWIANRVIVLCTAFLKRRMINNDKSISKTVGISQ